MPAPLSAEGVIGSIPVGQYPWGVAVDGANGQVYVSDSTCATLCSANGYVSAIDGSTNKVVATVQVGQYPNGLTVDGANGQVYVVDSNSNKLSVINASTDTLSGSVPLSPAGQLPTGIAVDPANGYLYVTDSDPNYLEQGYVCIVDGKTNTVAGTTLVGTNPFGVAVDGANGDIYVANAWTGNVSVISGATGKVVANVVFSGGGPEPNGVAVDPLNGNIYVADGEYGVVDVINGTTNAVTGSINVGMTPSGIAMDSANGYLYVTNWYSNTVSVIDGGTNKVVQTIPVGSEPYGVAVDPSNGYVYVANEGSKNVSVISTTNTYQVDLTESGLPAGTLWSATLGDFQRTSTTPSINFTDPNGTFPFAIGSVPGYYASPQSGSVVVNGTNANPPIAFTNSVVNVPVGSGPVGVVYDSANGYVYVADGGENNVTILSGTQVIAKVPAVNSPWGLAYDSQDQEVYATNWGNGGGAWVVTVINGTHTVANISDGFTNAAPMGVAYDSTNGTVWVANDDAKGLGVTVVHGLKTVWNLTNPPSASGIVFDPFDNYVYTSDRSSSWGRVDVMNASGTFDTVGTGGSTQPYWDIYDPYRHQVYVSEYGGNALMVMNGTKITGNITGVTSPMGVAVDPHSGLLYVTQYGQASVNVINGTQSVGTIPVGTNPIDAAYDPANGCVYVTDRGSNNVSIINTGEMVSMNLSAVVASPSSLTLSPNGTQVFTAFPSCTGALCAPAISYSWSLTSGPGILSSSSGNPVTFTAGTQYGTLSLFVNATLNGTTKQAGPIPITIIPPAPALASVSVSPPSASVLTNSTRSFSATSTCTGGPCPSGTSYVWSLNNSLGSVNRTIGATTTLIAGPAAGTVSLTVTATLNGISQQAIAPVTIVYANALTSVTANPSSSSVSINGTQAFTATPVCTYACPASVAYVWTVNSSLGSVTPTTGSTANFTAGPTVGDVRLTVVASLNGTTKWANATITIVPALSSVRVSPNAITIGVSNSSSFSAQLNCLGGACPSGATYSWTLNNSALGAISPTTGPDEVFTAGSIAGSETLFATASLNGHQATGLAIINITKGPLPTLTGLALAPPSTVLVQVGHSRTFNATPSCSVTPCPSGIAYTWVLNNSLGSLSSTSGPSVVFTAGSSAGTTGVMVTALFDAGSKYATSNILISTSAVPVITGVNIAPGSATVHVSQSEAFTANATCSPGPCPASTTYVWTLSNSLGSLKPSTGNSTWFTAGSSTGSVTLQLNATFNGKTVSAFAAIEITRALPPTGNSTASPTFLGLPGYDGYILVVVIAAVAVAAVMIALRRRKKTPTPPPPSTEPQASPPNPG